MKFIDEIKARASADKKTIILPESVDRRTFLAAEEVLREDIANIIIISTEEDAKKYGEGLDISKATIINPFTYEKTNEYAELLFELRKNKGMTMEEATKTILEDYMFYACLMIKCGHADGVVSGAYHSTANTLRPALQVLKTKPGTSLVSSFMLLEVPNCDLGYKGAFLMADCGLVQDPTSEELADIAASTAESFKLIFKDVVPKIAMLSHSTMGSAKHPCVTKVQDAVKIAHEKYPHLLVDGELQVDAALIPEVAASKAPGSQVAGQANVLIFPSLDAGNIGYKLVHRLAKASAYGPVTQGIAKSVNDLSRGCSWEDIVGVIAITAVQAQVE